MSGRPPQGALAGGSREPSRARPIGRHAAAATLASRQPRRAVMPVLLFIPFATVRPPTVRQRQMSYVQPTCLRSHLTAGVCGAAVPALPPPPCHPDEILQPQGDCSGAHRVASTSAPCRPWHRDQPNWRCRPCRQRALARSRGGGPPGAAASFGRNWTTGRAGSSLSWPHARHAAALPLRRRRTAAAAAAAAVRVAPPRQMQYTDSCTDSTDGLPAAGCHCPPGGAAGGRAQAGGCLLPEGRRRGWHVRLLVRPPAGIAVLQAELEFS